MRHLSSFSATSHAWRTWTLWPVAFQVRAWRQPAELPPISLQRLGLCQQGGNIGALAGDLLRSLLDRGLDRGEVGLVAVRLRLWLPGDLVRGEVGVEALASAMTGIWPDARRSTRCSWRQLLTVPGELGWRCQTLDVAAYPLVQ